MKQGQRIVPTSRPLTSPQPNRSIQPVCGVPNTVMQTQAAARQHGTQPQPRPVIAHLPPRGVQPRRPQHISPSRPALPPASPTLGRRDVSAAQMKASSSWQPRAVATTPPPRPSLSRAQLPQPAPGKAHASAGVARLQPRAARFGGAQVSTPTAPPARTPAVLQRKAACPPPSFQQARLRMMSAIKPTVIQRKAGSSGVIQLAKYRNTPNGTVLEF